MQDEIWADIEGYDGDYQESNYGRTKSFKNGKVKILRPVPTLNGYLKVVLSKHNQKNTKHIHQLVSQCFIPNPENLPEVNHKFGVKFDNYFENIEWNTHLKNIEHSFKIGLRKEGAEHKQAKLNEEQVREIRRIYIKGDSKLGALALAKKYGVSQQTILRVVNFKSYRNVK